jgi:hypothetical protein
MLKTMEDWKNGVLCVDRLMFELEEERKITIVKKPNFFYKEIKP